MPITFSGPALKLSPADIAGAAQKLGCLTEALQAVIVVETGGAGGFLSDGSGRPRILFEAKHFGDATGHQYDATHPHISCRVANWKLYAGGAAEYDRLAEAMALDEVAALKSTSWGLFQVMGFNAESVGYQDVHQFVEAMVESERCQLDAFGSFVQVNNLDDALRSLDWAEFARRYNGPSYAVNRYDTKLADAFARAAGAPRDAGLLRLGSTGADVKALQLRLVNLGFPCGLVDGIFGRGTEFAVRRFQSLHGLTADGVAGPATKRALGIGSAS